MDEDAIFEMVMRPESLSVVLPDHKICWTVSDVLTLDQVVVTLRQLADLLDDSHERPKTRCERRN